MVYTQVEMTPQTPENHMKKQGNNSPPPKNHEQCIHSTIHRYTLPRLAMSEKAHPLRVTRDRLYVGLCRRRIKGSGYLIAHLPNGGERDKNADSLVCSNVALESCEETALLEVLDVHDHEHTLMEVS